MKNLVFASFTLFLLASCNQTEINPGSDTTAANAGFVTLLGNDTLAVEEFRITESGITANVILRSPETSFSAYELTLDETGGIQELIRTNYSLENGFDGSGEIVQTIRQNGDSLWIETQTEEGMESTTASYEEGVLPFIDMVHWPFEVAFKKAVEARQDTINQPLLSGDNISNFVIAAIEGDSMTIRHPFRGVMGVQVNETGGIEHLDAGLTTRKLQVHRVSEIDIQAVGEGFAEADKSGNPFGQLSGAVTSEFSFYDTDFRVDYGSPQKRGRELFGGIVPWSERWRTGANRATHFYTSNDLQFGDLEVPAGEYTFYTIPEPDGGTLIINRQTGQNGNSYDESQDLGRVPMEISTQEKVTEPFTITVEEAGNNSGVLNLIWGETVFSVDFEIL